jgi:anti-anti-sigma factor
MRFEIDQSGSTSVLKLKGRCTVEHATDLRAVLIDTLTSREQLVVTLEEVDALDLSCLQLLCSAHRTSLDRNGSFILGGTVPEAFRRIVDAAGYCRAVSCPHDSDTDCLWKGGLEQWAKPL